MMCRWSLVIGFCIFGVQLALIYGDDEIETPSFSGLPENEEGNGTISYIEPTVEEQTDRILLKAPTSIKDIQKTRMFWEIGDIIHMINYSTNDKPLPSSCDEALGSDKMFGIRRLYIPNSGLKPFSALCYKHNDINWMIIQRRVNGAIDFYRDWKSYQKGFGNLYGDFWLGLDIISAVTNHRKHEIWFDMLNHKNINRHARYDNFLVGDESTNYTLEAVGKYTGDAGDSFRYQVGNQFSTKDVDNDSSKGSCAQVCKGAWWFGNCRESHFNGIYRDKDDSFPWGIHWYSWLGRDYSLKYVHMAIRPVKEESEPCD